MLKSPNSVIVTEGADKVVLIELTNRPGHYARVDLADYADWTKAQRSTTWFASSNGQGREYVAFFDPSRRGEVALVAREIAQSGPNEVIRYRNRDSLDMRRTNLFAARRNRTSVPVTP